MRRKEEENNKGKKGYYNTEENKNITYIYFYFNGVHKLFFIIVVFNYLALIRLLGELKDTYK